MSSFSVASAAQLTSTLKSANAGDVITLAAGDYGQLSLKNLHWSDDVTIKAAAGAKVSFSKVELVKVSNVTFDGILFEQGAKSGSKAFLFNKTKGIDIVNSTFDGLIDKEGYGTGQGLRVVDSTDFRLEDSVIRDFYVGASIHSSTGLTIKGNTLEHIGFDGMIIGKVHDALIEDNEIDLHVRKGALHTDGIQLWNSGTNDPASDVTIRGNHIETHNQASHGIFMGNANADIHGKAGAYKNILIEDNVIISGQVHGISVDRTDGLDIIGNTVLQALSVKDSRMVTTPHIRVNNDSTDVEISGNTTHALPASVNINWKSDKTPNKAWKIEDNKIVKLGTSADEVAKDKHPGGVKPVEKPGSDLGGNGEADSFRFNGKHGGVSKIVGLDFSEGDKITLTNFGADTFDHIPGGNYLQVNPSGRYAFINSIADLRELDAASGHVTIRDTGEDSILITITQSGRTNHSISVTEMAQDYDALL